MSRATQWAALKKLGLPDKAAAVVLGHAKAESGNIPFRVQGDNDAPAYTKSQLYTKWVDGGYITRDEFINNGPNGGGYGWLQWTERGRKAGFYDASKKLGLSIGSEELAIKWFWTELHQAQFAPVLAALTGDGSIREMSDVFMHQFEMPADQSEKACIYRAGLCEEAYDEFSGTVPDVSTPAQENAPTGDFKPFDMSVMMLQAIMAGNGYWNEEIDGKKTDAFRQRIVEFANDVANC